MKKLLKIVFAILVIGLAYYSLYPALNPSSLGFWIFISVVAVFLFILFFLGKVREDIVTKQIYFDNAKLIGKAAAVFGIIWAVIIVGMIVGGPVFNAKEYSERIEITTGNFEEEIAECDFNNLPLLDKDSSQKLGDRIIGQMPDLVSQFVVSEEYTQINYNGKIVRVTPLEYNGFFKYLSNRSNGTAGYVIVDSTTGAAELTRLDTDGNGLHFMPSGWFNENLYRHVQLCNPFTIFGESQFEVDEEGNPYWVVQILKYKFVSLKTEVVGVMIVNPIDGSMQRYSVDEVPSWVDNVYDASLITEQIDDWGAYKSGFLNAQFSQKNVTMATDGYTYLTMNDDVYMYTGITSVSNDESNIGFVLVNLRTKETRFYEIPGAEEYSAMDSAKGAVQEKNYTSTFPLLINLDGKPTYLLSLKDDAGLVKMYAFVDVKDYQKVAVTDASLGLSAAYKAYASIAGLSTNTTYSNTTTKKITIASVESAVIDGTTYYYWTDTSGNKYRVCITVDEMNLPFISVEDKVEVEFAEGTVKEIVTIK